MGEPEPVAPYRDPIEPDEQAIALRAVDFSTLPNAGTDAENWSGHASNCARYGT